MSIYSPSRLGTFETCPRQYWYAYIGKPEIEKVEGIEAFLGKRVHEALQELYKRLAGGQLMAEDQLLAWYEDHWTRNWTDDVRFVSQTFTAKDYRQVGRESLKAYYRRYQPFNQSRTLELEAHVFVNLSPDGKHRLQGYIDRLAQRADGAYEIHDYKTSRRLPVQADADQDSQLSIYQLAVEGMWPDVKQVDLIWHYVRFDKEIHSTRTPEQLAGVKEQCISTIDDIEARGREEAGFPTSPSNLCDWCDYKALCPAMRHHVAVAALPPEEFKGDAGVRLVDRWVQIRDRRQQLGEQDEALRAEEEAIQEQVIRFARQERLESVAGSSHYVDIVEKTKVDYPKTGDENREAFEKALRETGVWARVAAMNDAKFKSYWKDEAFPPAARKLLGPLISESVETAAKLREKSPREDQ